MSIEIYIDMYRWTERSELNSHRGSMDGQNIDIATNTDGQKTDRNQTYIPKIYEILSIPGYHVDLVGLAGQ